MKRIHLLAAIIASLATTFSAKALPVQYYTQNSKLESGKWLKIKTTGEGIHQITYDQLRQWGFEDPAKVNVYGYGATLLAADIFSVDLPDDINLTYSNHEKEKIYFYSTGDVSVKLIDQSLLTSQRNNYSTEVFYLLSDRDIDPNEAMPQAPFIADKQTDKEYDAHMSVFFSEEEIDNPTRMGGYFLGQDFTQQGSVNIPFTIKNIGSGKTDWTKFSARISFGCSSGTYSNSLKVSASSPFPTPTISQVFAGGIYDARIKYKVGSTTLRVDTSSKPISNGKYYFTASLSSNASYVALDTVWVMYPRLNKMDTEIQLPMFFPDVLEGGVFSIEAAPSIRVIDVSDIARIFPYELVQTDAQGVSKGMFPATVESGKGGCQLLVYDIAREFPGVELVEEIDNQNLHALQTPHMIVITTSELVEVAEELADLHRRFDGMDVIVVDHNKIFNEFSSATPHAMAYRRFIKMLYDRNPEKLQYVIMYGPSHWDNRQIIVDKNERLLVYETLTPEYSGDETKAFGTDTYFGMLQDDFNPRQLISTAMNIPVGRISAADPVKARVMNAKIKNYLENPPTAELYNKVVFMSDDGDKCTHLNQSEQLADALLATRQPSMPIRVHNANFLWKDSKDAQDLRAVLINALEDGTGLFTYVGHGSDEAFGGENLWSRSLAARTQYNHPTIGLFATCTAFGFDLGKDGVGQEMLFKEDGGAIALITAGRTVYADLNQHIALPVVREYAAATSSTTIGHLWMNARNNAIKGALENSKVNTMCYNLGGDPALRLFAPSYKVDAVLSSESNTVSPLQPINIEGRILNPDGELADDFDGQVTITLLDAPYEVDILQRKSDDVQQSSGKPRITLDQEILTSKTIDVKAGLFNVNISAPVPMHENEKLPNRILFYADASDGRRADGVANSIKIAAPTGNIPDIAQTSAPQIKSIQITNLPDGVQFTATGSIDPVGFNTSSAIRVPNSLVIDGSKVVPGVNSHITYNPDDATQWTISMPIYDLSAGKHTATLTIVDNAGGSTSQSANFEINTNARFTLKSDKTTFRDQITFYLDDENTTNDEIASVIDEIAEGHLIIEDIHGNTLISKQISTVPVTIDFAAYSKTVPDAITGNNPEAASQNIPDGHYYAYVKLLTTTGNRYYTPRLQVVYISHP